MSIFILKYSINSLVVSVCSVCVSHPICDTLPAEGFLIIYFSKSSNSDQKQLATVAFGK